MQNAAQADGPLVLIAEDDRDLRDLFDNLLADEGYRVLTVANGAAALALVEYERPALILLDINLPLLSGGDFCRVYRDRGRAAPLILVTEASPNEVAAVMAACEATAYILKPFDVEVVLATVARLVAP